MRLALFELLKRADSEDYALRGDEARELEIFEKLITIGVLIKGEDLTEIECDACGDGHVENVVWITEPPGSQPRAYIGCPGVGRVAVEQKRLEIWRVDLDKVANIVGNVLSLSAPRVLIKERVWLLGTRDFGERTRDIFLIRGATWPDASPLLIQEPRLRMSPCPLILFPDVLPSDSSWTGRDSVLLSMLEFDWFRENSDAVAKSIARTVVACEPRISATETTVFRKTGSTWMLRFKGKTIYIEHILGLKYICELLRKPGVPITAAELAGVSAKHTNLSKEEAIPMADKPTIKDVRITLDRLKAELAALPEQDSTREKIKGQIFQFETYLRQNERRRGEARMMSGTSEKARTSVTNAINLAIRHVSTRHPDLGRHLKESIRMGRAPLYTPLTVPDWNF